MYIRAMLAKKGLGRVVLVVALGGAVALAAPHVNAQETTPESSPASIRAEIGEGRDVVVNTAVNFDATGSTLPEGESIEETLWDFGDGVQTTGDHVAHTYRRAGTYTVRLRLTTTTGSGEDTAEIRVFDRSLVLIAGATTPSDQLELRRNQAADGGVLLLIVRPKTSGPEVVTEDDLIQQLINILPDVARSPVVATWTAGSVGANVLSKFGQVVRQAAPSTVADIDLSTKGVIIMTDTPLGVLAPTAQTAFDQLKPAYVLLTRPQAFELFLLSSSAEDAKNNIFASPLEYRLLGTFSARALRDIGPTNFISYGLSFLVNRGVPISSILLILMLPVIATILAFTRQVIGIKSFGLITPTMTTVAFLVMGLSYGLIVFACVLLAGTLARMALRRLRLLYMPRMALVLCGVSIAILLLLGVESTFNSGHVSSFSIFPTLILILLAEEFIAVQFKSGAKSAATITAWTLLLAILSYFIVSWELLRTLFLSYPEVVLLTIPINLLLGRWTGLRLTEYFRFRQLLRYAK